jgi:hypothetical protein
LHKQLFGIAITELTSLLARRSVYCSKYPNSDFSVSRFDDAQGNIRFKLCPTLGEMENVFFAEQTLSSISGPKNSKAMLMS